MTICLDYCYIYFIICTGFCCEREQYLQFGSVHGNILGYFFEATGRAVDGCPVARAAARTHAVDQTIPCKPGPELLHT